MPEINTGNVPNTDTAPLIAPVETVAAPQAPQVTPEPQAPVSPWSQAQQPAPVVQVAPPATTDRTREQFEKLLENNSKLFEANENLRLELEKRSTANQTFTPIQQPPVSTPAPKKEVVDPQDFIETDPTTGDRFINESRLKARIDEINNNSSRAAEAVKQYAQAAEQREIERQNREAFTVYPELNPNAEKFDKTFSNNTRALIYDSLINPQDYGGRSLDFKEAADVVRAQYQGKKQVQETPQENPEQLSQAAQTLKQQASAGATGQQPLERSNAGGDADLESLRLKTRLGDRTALAQRIFAAEQAAKNETN